MITDIEAVLGANAAFYDALASADYRAMDLLWSERRAVTCTHPSGPGIAGRDEVMDSWRVMFDTGNAPAIRCLEPHCVVTGNTALVLCIEEVGPMRLMASNSYVLEDGIWRMTNHQSAPIPSRS